MLADHSLGAVRAPEGKAAWAEAPYALGACHNADLPMWPSIFVVELLSRAAFEGRAV